MQFNKRSRKIHFKKKQEKRISISFLFYIFIGLGVLALFILIIYGGHERQLSRLRQEKIKEDMATIATALSLYYQAFGHYPTMEKGLQSLMEQQSLPSGPDVDGAGGYLTHVPRDPWNNFYEYKVLESDMTFDLICLGSDGRPGGEGEAVDIHWKK